MPSSVAFDVHQRVTALEDPAVHDATYRFAGDLLERVPQVGGLGGAERVAPQVLGDAGAERLGAQVLLEHAHHRRALLVGEDVEHALGVGRR